MNKEKSIPIGPTFTLMLLATVPGITFYTFKETSAQNSWLSLLIGSLLGVLFIWMIISIRNYSEKSIFEINKIALGKIFGTIVNFIFCLVFILFAIIISWHSYVFLKSQYLNETPFIVIAISLLLPGLFMISKSNTILIKMNMFIFPAIALLCIFAVVGLVFQLDIDNIKPFAEIENASMLYGIFTYFSITILPTYAITSISNLKNKKNIFKYFAIGIILNFCITLFTYLVLGRILVDFVDFPEFFVLRKIGNSTNSARIDSFIIVEWIICIFSTVSCCFFFVKNCLKNYIKNYNSIITYIFGFIISFVSLYAFESITDGKNFILKVLPYISFFTIFVTNFIIFIILKIKKKPLKVSHK